MTEPPAEPTPEHGGIPAVVLGDAPQLAGSPWLIEEPAEELDEPTIEEPETEDEQPPSPSRPIED
jgi:hypothetical protein